VVHPEKDPARSIDLKELVDTLVLRGISLPILIRFAEILKHRLGELHRRLSNRHRRAQVQGRLLLRLPDQGQPAAPGGGRSARVRQALQVRPGSRLQARADGRDGLADNDTPIICNGFKDDEYIEMAMLAQKIGRQIIPVVEKYTELDLIAEVRRARRRAAHDRPARQAGQPRLRPLEIVGRLPLQVRPDGHRGHARAAGAEGRRAWPIASSCSTSTWAARSPTSARSRAR
jgi:hypothetical protein